MNKFHWKGVVHELEEGPSVNRKGHDTIFLIQYMATHVSSAVCYFTILFDNHKLKENLITTLHS